MEQAWRKSLRIARGGRHPRRWFKVLPFDRGCSDPSVRLPAGRDERSKARRVNEHAGFDGMRATRASKSIGMAGPGLESPTPPRPGLVEGMRIKPASSAAFGAG